MINQLPGKLLAFPMLPLLWGSCLALIPHSSPAQIRIDNNHSIFLAQQTLPPLPNVRPAEPVEFYQYNQNLQPYQPVQVNQYSQNFQRYLVYVDSSNFQTLQLVRQIEPGAYIRQYQGRSVIQTGIFDRLANAQNRLADLRSYGINEARLVSFADGREIPTSASFSTTGQEIPTLPGSPNNQRQQSNYYVAIPADSREIPVIADNIRRNIGQYGIVLEREQPRGPHIAVGPFAGRTEAEQWNKYLRNLGYGNARVYYGR
ncbi:MAG: hypothetical protein AB3A66_25900 [Nodularia sp. CChRGM 3473]